MSELLLQAAAVLPWSLVLVEAGILGAAISKYHRIVGQKDKEIEVIKSISSHDALTGLKNRHALREEFPGYAGKVVWFVMADIDHFKKYNDTYGHETGDAVLRLIGKSIQDIFGETCTYRYGGDEFLIIYKSEKIETVRHLLEKWEEEVKQIRIEAGKDVVAPRCSYGLAGGKAQDKNVLRQFLRLSDERLYEAKAQKGDLL